MEYVTTIDPVKDPRWDKFVENHPFGWICHLSGWKQVLEKSFPHMRGYYLALLDDRNNHIKAGMPVFEVRSWLTGKRLVSIPFATLCDPLISSSEEMQILFDEALNLSKKFRNTYIEIRSLSSSPLIRNNQFGESRFYKHHYLLLENEPEQLRKKFHRTCVRQRISRAIESNLSLRVGDSESDLNSFYQLHVLTRRRLRLPPQPYNYFKLLWNTFSPTKKMIILLAEKEGKTIASLILFKFKDRVSAEFAASDETFRDLSPNHFLFWEAIKSAYHEGYKIFDFGRTSPSNEALMDFKNRWGTKVIDLPQYFYPKQALEKLSKEEESIGFRLVQKICEKAPDYTLQPIGRFCYRHLG
jgi:hypothetical protein